MELPSAPHSNTRPHFGRQPAELTGVLGGKGPLKRPPGDRKLPRSVRQSDRCSSVQIELRSLKVKIVRFADRFIELDPGCNLRSTIHDPTICLGGRASGRPDHICLALDLYRYGFRDGSVDQACTYSNAV